MATRKHTITGELQWAKLNENNRDMTGFNDVFVKHDGAYTVDVIVSKEEFAAFKEATKTMIKGSSTDDGRIKFKLKRPHEGPFEEAGGAPRVVDSKGKKWDDEVVIGNGTTAEVAVSAYDIKAYSGSVGTRLEAVKIVDLVEYSAPATTDDFDIADLEEVVV